MKELMIRAHQIAKTLEGNYSARMSIALKQAWSEFKMEKQTLTEQFEIFLGFKFESPSNSRISEMYLTKTIVVKYSDYKNNLSSFGYKVKTGNYDASTKTIELKIKLSSFWGTEETVEEMIERKINEKSNFELNRNFGRIERLVIGNNFSNYKEIKEAIAKCTIL